MAQAVAQAQSSTGKIKPLADHVINQIAAGEVVDRPVSVVRELVDNAIDSGADDVTITVEEGGRQRIRVSDNGCGMSADDAVMAFERHATSKIKVASDLNSIATFGFRGEALAAIASISKIRLRTRESNAPVGTELELAAGKIINVAPCSGSAGTEIEVAQLFYNTPARRAFLKLPPTELARIKTWVLHSSLANSTVRYRVVSEGNEIINLPKVSSLIERATRFVKGESSSFKHDIAGLKIEGVVGHPSLAQGDANGFVILVNGRLIKDKMIMRAVKEGFDSTLKGFEYPVGVISLEVPPDQIDVNVHPQKSEVRFRSTQGLFVAIREVVLRAVRNFRSPVSSALGGGSEPSELISRGSPQLVSMPFPSYQQPSLVLESGVAIRNEESAPEKFRYSELRYIGQLLECYLLCELRGQFVLVDMHAAHERYNFNVIREGFERRSVRSQVLLVPQSVNLDPERIEQLLEHQALLADYGIELERFGEESLLVRALPGMIEPSKVKVLLEDLSQADLLEGTLKNHANQIAARLACHASIRAGYQITREEVYALFDSLDNSEFSAACPHGRPVIVSFTKEQVESWFGRDK